MMNGQIVAELQSLGLRLEADIVKRSGGAGPAEGGTILFDGIPVCLPVGGAYVAHSPYSLKTENGHSLLLKNGQIIRPVELVSPARFYDSLTAEGIPFSKIALLHGKDCLATTILQTCTNWRDGQQCRFCGIEVSLKNQQTISRKDPQQIAEVAQRARDLDSIQQVLLTTGRGITPEEELSHLARCASAVKKTTGLPIQAQFLPPPDPEGLDRLKEAGVDSVGIHIESFDNQILSALAPFKAALGLKRFEQAWKRAVELFGPNQVSSFLIVGLGEKAESVIRGGERLSDLGVYPFIVPFRPIPGSLMEKDRPPDPHKMIGLYETMAEVLKRKGLVMAQQKAGCVRCGACSAMAFFEQPPAALICHPAWSRQDFDQAFQIRHQVFVREQNLFERSDADQNDAKSTHLVAELEGRIVGTVRVFPTGDSADWIGGRLAILKEYRKSGAGELLVRTAVSYVKKQGCNQFNAQIQKEKVSFFSRLGWKAVGPVFDYHGKPHQLMEADLDSLPANT